MQIVLIVLVILDFVVASAPRPYTLHIKRLTTENMDTSIINASVAYNESHMSVSLDIPKTLRVPITIHLTTDVKSRDSYGARGFVNLLNVTQDICQFLENPSVYPLVNLFYMDLKRDVRNKIITRCPIEAGHYWIADCTLNIGKLSLTLPSMYYRTKFQVHSQEGMGVAKNWRKLIEVNLHGDMGNIKSVTQRTRRPKYVK